MELTFQGLCCWQQCLLCVGFVFDELFSVQFMANESIPNSFAFVDKTRNAEGTVEVLIWSGVLGNFSSVLVHERIPVTLKS